MVDCLNSITEGLLREVVASKSTSLLGSEATYCAE